MNVTKILISPNAPQKKTIENHNQLENNWRTIVDLFLGNFHLKIRHFNLNSVNKETIECHYQLNRISISYRKA